MSVNKKIVCPACNVQVHSFNSPCPNCGHMRSVSQGSPKSYEIRDREINRGRDKVKATEMKRDNIPLYINSHPITTLFYFLSALSVLGVIIALAKGTFSIYLTSIIIAGGLVQASFFIGFGLIIQYLYEIAYIHKSNFS